MQKLQENFFGGWFQPVKKEPTRTFHGPSNCPCGGNDPLCDVCTKLRKHIDMVQVKPVYNFDDFNWQFDTPLAGWSNDMKDAAINNNGSLGAEKSKALGTPFRGKLLPPRKPHGFEYHAMKDPCFKAGPPNGVRFVNSYRESTDNCEPVCGPGVCREYGDAMERYAQCMERCRDMPLAMKRQMCGNQPVNPKNNGCKGCGSPPPEYALNSVKRWAPDMAYRKSYQ